MTILSRYKSQFALESKSDLEKGFLHPFLMLLQISLYRPQLLVYKNVARLLFCSGD